MDIQRDLCFSYHQFAVGEWRSIRSEASVLSAKSWIVTASTANHLSRHECQYQLSELKETIRLHKITTVHFAVYVSVHPGSSWKDELKSAFRALLVQPYRAKRQHATWVLTAWRTLFNTAAVKNASVAPRVPQRQWKDARNAPWSATVKDKDLSLSSLYYQQCSST